MSGIQLCAQIGSIPALNSATGVILDGLSVRAGLAAGTGLQLDIDLPTDKAVRDRALPATYASALLKLMLDLTFSRSNLVQP